MKRAKQIWNIVTFGALMTFLIAACHKDPTPEPQPNPDNPNDTITPGDTITPVVHHYPDTIYVPFELKLSALSNTDTISFYANQPDVKKIAMDLAPMDSLYTSEWTWRAYDKMVDSLNKRHEIAPDKVIGRGTIIVERIIPDSIINASGMPKRDSVALKDMGFDIFARHNR